MEILNGILDLSKIESGKLSLQKGSVQIRSLASSVVDTFQPRAEEKGNQIKAEVAPNVLEYIEADEVRIKQVLLNLVSNAVKFTDNGTIVVSVRREIIESEAGHFNLVFEVGPHPEIPPYSICPFGDDARIH